MKKALCLFLSIFLVLQFVGCSASKEEQFLTEVSSADLLYQAIEAEHKAYSIVDNPNLANEYTQIQYNITYINTILRYLDLLENDKDYKKYYEKYKIKNLKLTYYSLLNYYNSFNDALKNISENFIGSLLGLENKLNKTTVEQIQIEYNKSVSSYNEFKKAYKNEKNDPKKVTLKNDRLKLFFFTNDNIYYKTTNAAKVISNDYSLDASKEVLTNIIGISEKSINNMKAVLNSLDESSDEFKALDKLISSYTNMQKAYKIVLDNKTDSASMKKFSDYCITAGDQHRQYNSIINTIKFD